MVFETDRFTCSVEVFGDAKEPLYVVRNKVTGVAEFTNSGLYFVRAWCLEMTRELAIQDWEIEHPGLDYDKEHNKVVPFPNGGKSGGKSN